MAGGEEKHLGIPPAAASQGLFSSVAVSGSVRVCVHIDVCVSHCLCKSEIAECRKLMNESINGSNHLKIIT